MFSVRKGKIGELIVAIDLLNKGLHVYEPIVDDNGIDLLVSNGEFTKSVQCKINQVMIREESNQTFVSFLLELNKERYNIEGVGAGFVDAIVTSIFKTLKHQYISLFDFYFSDFYTENFLKNLLYAAPWFGVIVSLYLFGELIRGSNPEKHNVTLAVGKSSG